MAAVGGTGVGQEEGVKVHQQDSDGGNKRKLDAVELAKQKAQEIAARLYNNATQAESKRSRFDETSNTASFSQLPSFSDGTQKPTSATPYPVQSGAQYGFQGSSKKIEIPNAKVGVIIGKGGETIKYLQLQSGARIHITKDTDADPYSQTRDVEINGTSEQITRAEQLINDVIAETDAGGPGSSGARGSTFVSPGGDQFEMKVPNDKVAWVIGKGGETIKSIQSRSGARIQIVPLHPPPGDTSTERSVFISGTQEQIDSAKELVNDVVSGNRLRNLSTTNSYPQQGYAPPGQWTQPPMQQPGYPQPGPYPTPPYYANYPPQQAAWDQSNPQQYNYYQQQTPTETGSTQPNQTYGYTQTPPPTNSYEQGYSQPQSYAQDIPTQAPQHDQQNQYSAPGYGPPATSTQPDGTQPPALYPSYSQPQTGYGPPQTYMAQGYDQTGYAQSGYGGQKPPQYPPPGQSPVPVAQPGYGQGGYASQPAPTQPAYVQGTAPPVYGQQPSYGSERNGDGSTAHPSYGSSPAVQEGGHPPPQS